MTTFTALGDSITLGIGDPVRDGRTRPDGRAERAWRGWAALLADGLTDPELHILAASGACASQIEREQLPRALGLRPDIASVISESTTRCGQALILSILSGRRHTR